MKAVISRVLSARVIVDDEVVGAIPPLEAGTSISVSDHDTSYYQFGHDRQDRGLLVLLGVARGDGSKECEAMADKIARLRIFDDPNDEKAEVSALDLDVPILVVSQFTLMGDTRKGRRPSWSPAAPGSDAEKLVNEVASALAAKGLTVNTGSFGSYMKVESVNDGPFTVLVEIPPSTDTPS